MSYKREKKLARICFLADSHGLFDDRIYWKEALSLKKNDYEIHYILAGDKNDSGLTPEGIHYYYVKKDFYPKNRIFNFLAKRYLPNGFYRKMLQKAKTIKADIYHIHDLKVNRIGRKLKILDHHPKIIYDIHEPYPENIIDYRKTSGIITILKKIYAQYVGRWEQKCAKRYDQIIVTEENLYQRFASFMPAGKVQIIYNYTDLPVKTQQTESSGKAYDVIYTGGITEQRGAFSILEAIKILAGKQKNIKMLFLGTYFPADLKKKMEQFVTGNQLQSNIILHDAVPYQDVGYFYQKSRIGLGIFLPIKTHRIILQIKLFEYMNYGLPIVGSNFGHVNRIIRGDDVGIAIDPEDPEKIAGAIYNLLSDDKLYNTFSKNAREAVQKKYRWEFMEEKLTSIYSDLLHNKYN